MSTESEQVKALARVITASLRNGSWALSTPRDFAEAIVTSEVLAEVKAAARAEHGERIAQAIEATIKTPLTEQERWQNSGVKAAARIARSTT